MTRRTKIVATLGPASSSNATIAAMLRAGTDVVRLNFSHGTRAEHARTIEAVRAAGRETGRTVSILADLQGPRVRLGRLRVEPLFLRRGDRVDLVPASEAAPLPASPTVLPVSYARLAKDLHPRARVLIADGQVELVVRRIEGRRVVTTVAVGGAVASRKGINLPDAPAGRPALTRKDLDDLRFAARAGVDFVAVSFVAAAADVRDARRHLRREGSDAGVIAKIEREAAVRNLGAILEAADGVIVARGDLAVEVGHENVPILQKQILSAANARACPSVTATQMLESMTENPRPTRAEASDVANAVFDGTDAVMLSGETAIGRDPVAVVRTMARIAARVERSLARRGFPVVPASRSGRADGAIGRAAILVARELRAARLVAFTKTGRTARLVSRERPVTPIVGFAETDAVARRMTLLWGVRPRVLRRARSTADLARRGESALRRSGDLRPGDRAIFLTGTSSLPGGTNTIQVRETSRPEGTSPGAAAGG